ncbi:Hypothetical protein DEACI_3040 [Acididesulfobacillus acetoxydans]|uniref:Uncharacterized protein n=1 Tax=Acididesulfobacillus acetoxydans TaxID=1561005 RepID=A0A8S0XCE8_9FIRM|nr:hypothetical protein [Acididesulfobacillus acetoxydans]CAA7602366.1 Hypothetical protein DEACI_3040 [Acididesulfobacillus acetoxydans]CEJ08399.1 Hypothetical protein DEACI_2875 [Acididesulfobacillus acetoxydans]
MFRDVLEGVVLGVSLLVIFMVTERIEAYFRKRTLLDKFIDFLEGVYSRTAPQEDGDVAVKEYALSDKIKIRKLRFYKGNPRTFRFRLRPGPNNRQTGGQTKMSK